MLLALSKIITPCCFVMPARIAATDPFKQISEHVGSGPMRFIKDEWTPGARAVFEKFADYMPRSEPASWLAGGKRIVSDRVEWITIADPATAAAAPLHAGVCRRRQDVEAAARLLHPAHAALHRGRRRNPQRTTQSRCRQTFVSGKQLCRRARHLHGSAGSCTPQGLG